MSYSSIYPVAWPGLLQSPLLNVSHGMFNRHGGVSPEPFASLNISFGVGDNHENVAANRQIIKKTLNIPLLLSAGQIHGDKVLCIADAVSDLEVDGYDALITDQEGVGLMIQQADCQAILLHDPERKVIAAIHCGWRGSAANIIRTTIREMQQRYGVNPAVVRAVISPSLGPCCAEFVNYKTELPGSLHGFMVSPNHFNFWDISACQLEKSGVLSENIGIAGICTVCDTNYFSYRRSQKRGEDETGRNSSVISLGFS